MKAAALTSAAVLAVSPWKTKARAVQTKSMSSWPAVRADDLAVMATSMIAAIDQHIADVSCAHFAEGEVLRVRRHCRLPKNARDRLYHRRSSCCVSRGGRAHQKNRRQGRPSITKTERPRSAILPQMPRGLMCKLRQRGRGYGGPAGPRRIDPSCSRSPAQQLLGPSSGRTVPRQRFRLNPHVSTVCPAPDVASVWVAPHRARLRGIDRTKRSQGK